MKLLNPNLLDYVNQADVFNRPFFDWLNFTSIRPAKLKKQSDRLAELYELIRIFKGVSFVDVSKTKQQLEFDSLDNTIRLIANSNHLSVQFKGAFFIIHFMKAYDYLKYVYKELMSGTHYKYDESQPLIRQWREPELLNNWTISRMDIKRDLLDQPLINSFPIYHSGFRAILDPDCENYYFGFEGDFKIHTRKQEITGWDFYGTDYKLTVYDKQKENRGQKSKIKQSAYDLLYKTDLPITRIELRMDGSRLNAFATHEFRKMVMIGEEIEYSELCDNVLKRFYDRRRVYINSGKHRTNEEEEPRWKNFFNPENREYSKERITRFEFKTTSEIEDAKKYFKIALKKAFIYSKDRKIINKVIDECAGEALKEIEEIEQATIQGRMATQGRAKAKPEAGA